MLVKRNWRKSRIIFLRENEHLVLLKVALILLFIGCSTSLPMYSNAMLFSGGNQTNYFNGHVLTYECNSNFASNTSSLQCTCNATTDPHQWICSPEDLASTCRKSKMLHD